MAEGQRQDATCDSVGSDSKANTLPQETQFLKEPLASVYALLCRKLKLPTSERLSGHLKSAELALNLDALEGKEVELVAPLLAGLRPADAVYLWSREFEVRIRASSHLPTLKPDPRDLSAPTKQAKFLAKVASGLASNVSRSPTLLALSLFDLKLGIEGWKLLAKALFFAPQIESLSLVSCKLAHQGDPHAGIAALVDAACALGRLRALHLAGNDLRSPGAHYVARVVGFHGQRRDRDIWTQTLRGETKKTATRGLIEIGLADCAIDQKAGEELMAILSTDIWIQSIDLRGNLLSPGVVKGLLRLHRSSVALKVLDLRNVPAAEAFLSKLLLRTKRKLRKEKHTAETHFLHQKCQEISEDAVFLLHFPLQLLTRPSRRTSKSGSVSASFVATSASLPLNERRRAKSAGPVLKIPSAPSGHCLRCAALQLQLRTAQARVSVLEKEISEAAEGEKDRTERNQRGENRESLVAKAERLVQELVETLDLLDRVEKL